MDSAWENFGKYVCLLVAIVIVGLITAWPLMWSWNYVMPYLFGFKVITWGQHGA